MHDTLSSALLAKDAVRIASDGQPTLVGGCCGNCGTKMFPLTAVCPSCMGEQVTEEEMPRNGKLYSFTVMHVGGARWKKPTILGYVDLPNGVRVFTHLQGDKLEIDMPVQLAIGEVAFEDDKTPINSYVFKSAE